MTRRIRSFLVPAAVFQSVIVGGAYGTGREVVEFISTYGALGGFLSIAVIGVCFSLVLAASFEFARTFSAWDYRHFLRELLGRGWFVYEILFLLLLIIVLAVTAAAAGTVLNDAFALSHATAIGLLFLLVVVLNYFGREIVKRTLTAGAVVLSVGLIGYCVLILTASDADLAARVASDPVKPGWWLSGVKFAVYNSALIPAIVYCASDIDDRRTALGAGILAGFLGVLPAMALHATFVAGLPGVLDQAIPTYWMLEQFGHASMVPIYVVILFATIVQTGVGVLQGLNERLDGWYQDTHGRKLSRPVHAVIAGTVLFTSLLLSELGIVELVARGYGTIAWGFLIVFTVPVISVGIYKIRLAGNKSHDSGGLS